MGGRTLGNIPLRSLGNITSNVHVFQGHKFDLETYTVKTFGLLQPYFGHLSCMPVV